MSASTIVLAILLGVAAGVLSGLFGVGGGILFVPALLALGLGQLEAQGTSLLAILPTVLAGTWNQRRYGNLRPRTALVLGLASIAGVEVGARLATELPESTTGERAVWPWFLTGWFGLGLIVVLIWALRRR